MVTVIEVPSGAIDGVNTAFQTSKPYLPGSLYYFLNGQLKRPDLDDGFVETDPTAGKFQVKEAPLTDDVVQVYYLTSEGTAAEDFGTPKLIVGIVEYEASLDGDFRVEPSPTVVSLSAIQVAGALHFEEVAKSEVITETTLQGRVVVADL